MESSVARLREYFILVKNSIEEKLGVYLGWSGDGNHKSVLGIDIYRKKPPAGYLGLRGVERDRLEVHDPKLLARTESALEEFMYGRRKGWHIVHMGNGNTEMPPGVIEKDLALKTTPEFKDARHILVWGDSKNDRNMFNLQKYDSRVKSCLVLHRRNSLKLLDTVDLVTFGMANTQPLFELLASTKR